MALPQQVVEQLSQEEAPRTPGWSFGVMLFSGSILLIVLVIYAGLRFGYEPYLTGQMNALQSKVNDLGQSISPAEEASLVTFYSEIGNLESLVTSHVLFSHFLTWIEQNTEANVYYNTMSFASGDQVTLAGYAKTAADIPEQIAVFESSPDVSSVVLSSVSYSASSNNWVFNVVLTMNPDLLQWTASSTVSTPMVNGSPTSTPVSAPLPLFGAPTASSSPLPSSSSSGNSALPKP